MARPWSAFGRAFWQSLTATRRNPSRRAALRFAAPHIARPAGRHALIEPLERRQLLTASLVADIQPGANGSFSSTSTFTTIGGDLFFVANDGASGRELWRSNGTSSGTALVSDIQPGSGGFVSELTALQGKLLFSAIADPLLSHSTLWTSDGTSGGTQELSADGKSPHSLLVADNVVYYFTDWPTVENGLWVTDGTPAGTVPVNVAPDVEFDTGDLLFKHNNTLYFNGLEPYPQSPYGRELYRSGGTSSGVQLVRDIFPGSYYINLEHYPNQSSPGDFTPLNGQLLFTATTSTGYRDLWKTDGTSAGTVEIRNFGRSSGGGLSTGFKTKLGVIGNTMYFSANGGAANGEELWKTNGTSSGTVMVRDIRPGSGGSVPSSAVVFHDSLFFVANDGTNGNELWTSNGTSSGTFMVSNIAAGSASSNPASLTVVNGRLVFTANNGTLGAELWSTNGTSSGTILLADVNPGAAGSNPRHLTAVGGELFFAANDGVHGEELWKIDIVNQPPTAPGSGGPYAILAGAGLSLTGVAATDPDPGDVLTYAWDINGDGTFGDATGLSPTLSWAQLIVLGVSPSYAIRTMA